MKKFLFIIFVILMTPIYLILCFLGKFIELMTDITEPIEDGIEELNRKYIGIEIDPEYYKISIDRLEGILENGQISMFIN